MKRNLGIKCTKAQPAIGPMLCILKVFAMRLASKSWVCLQLHIIQYPIQVWHNGEPSFWDAEKSRVGRDSETLRASVCIGTSYKMIAIPGIEEFIEDAKFVFLDAKFQRCDVGFQASGCHSPPDACLSAFAQGLTSFSIFGGGLVGSGSGARAWDEGAFAEVAVDSEFMFAVAAEPEWMPVASCRVFGLSR